MNNVLKNQEVRAFVFFICPILCFLGFEGCLLLMQKFKQDESDSWKYEFVFWHSVLIATALFRAIWFCYKKNYTLTWYSIRLLICSALTMESIMILNGKNLNWFSIFGCSILLSLAIVNLLASGIDLGKYVTNPNLIEEGKNEKKIRFKTSLETSIS
jgi:hypothetical protein